MRGYTQLTHEELYQIYILKKTEYIQTEIAGLLERDKLTISRDAVADGLIPYIDWVHTITYDNGREFADHGGMASDLDACNYFAHPFQHQNFVNRYTSKLNPRF